MDSILNSIKKLLGPSELYDNFDTDIIMHINSTMTSLSQMGIGPKSGFSITGPDETWDDYIQGDLRYESVKQYIYLSVRTVFDPPTSSAMMDFMKEKMKELEWRLNLTAESGK